MGGFSAGTADSTVLVPSADTTVVLRLLSQGLSANPGRHSQTVPEASAAGEALAAGDAAADGDAVVEAEAVARGDAAADGDAVGSEDESSHEMPTTAVRQSAAPTRIAHQARRLMPPLPNSSLVRRLLDRVVIAPTSLRMFAHGVVCRRRSHVSTRLLRSRPDRKLILTFSTNK